MIQACPSYHIFPCLILLPFYSYLLHNHFFPAPVTNYLINAYFISYLIVIALFFLEERHHMPFYSISCRNSIKCTFFLLSQCSVPIFWYCRLFPWILHFLFSYLEWKNVNRVYTVLLLTDFFLLWESSCKILWLMVYWNRFSVIATKNRKRPRAVGTLGKET